jgi:selenocysteine lyase/cysteine desulfurase
LFLPAVDNLGVQLPVRAIVRETESRSNLGFVVVDGAQVLGHVPIDLCDDTCDLFVGGCHKWLRAYLPMGLAFAVRRRSQQLSDQTLLALLRSRQIDDPLLRFVRQIESDDTDGYLETTNISPLISCCGAIVDLTQSSDRIHEASAVRSGNADRILNAMSGTGWGWLRSDDGLRSSVVLLQSRCENVRSADPNAVRAAFRRAGILLSNYNAGMIRLSMPDMPLSSEAPAQVHHALASVN